MQYLHLVYLSDRMMKEMHHDERCSTAAAVRRMALQGLPCRLRGFSAVSSNGNSLVTDGPFVETKEYRVSS